MRFNKSTVGESVLKASAIVAVLVSVGILSPLPSVALDPKLSVRQYMTSSWNRTDGLEAIDITDLAQGPTGYLWIASKDNLTRFDGASFDKYDSGNTLDLASDFSRTLMVDNEGNLWIGFVGGMARYKDGRFKMFTTDDGLPNDDVRAIAQDSVGSIWVGTYGGGLVKMVGDSFVAYEAEQGLSDLRVTCIETDEEGVLWIGTESGINRIDDDGVKVFDESSGLMSKGIVNLYRDGQGRTWVATAKGLNRITGDVVENPGNVMGLDGIAVLAMLIDRDENIWIGTESLGVLRVQGDEKEPRVERVPEVGQTNAIAEDREGNIWLASWYTGLVRISNSKFVTYSTPQVGDSDIIWALAEDSNNTVWSATHGGLGKLVDDQIELFDADPFFGELPTYAVAVSKDGSLWVGTNGKGLARLENDRYVEAYSTENGLSDDRIRAIHEDKDGTVWVGTVSGLNRIQDGKITSWTTKDGLPAERISAIHRFDEKTLWLGTTNGLSVFKDGKFTDLKFADDPLGRRINEFFEDSKKNIWLATYNGLYVYHDKGFLVLNRGHGLAENKLLAIYEDDTDRIWWTDSSGVHRASRVQMLKAARGEIPSLEVKSFDTSDGLPTSEMDGGFQNCGIRGSDGRLYFSTGRGVAAIQPHDYFQNETVPKVLLQEGRADGTLLKPGRVIKSGPVRFDFSYTATSFVAPEKVRFKHMLEGLDSDWVDGGNQRQVQYLNLKPGPYTFKVKAANNDGVWNEEPAVFSFEITPLFTETIWFYLLVVLGVLLIIAGTAGVVSFLNVRRTRSQEAQTSALAWERTREVLAGQMDGLRTLAEDISTVAGSMKGLMGQLSSSASQVSSSVTETARSLKKLEQSGKDAESNAGQIVGAVDEAKAESMKGVSASERSSRLMNVIQGQSLNIAHETKNLFEGLTEVDRIITLVQDIAEQSKLLAVNATIEAAHAGEAGIGFATVATEMKDLANQSKGSVKEITAVLTAVRRAIDVISVAADEGRTETIRGTKAISESSDIVRSLGSKIEANSEMAGTIGHMVSSILMEMQAISSNVYQIDLSVAENAGMGREINKGVERLDVAAAALLETINEWKTPEFYGTSNAALNIPKGPMGKWFGRKTVDKPGPRA